MFTYIFRNELKLVFKYFSSEQLNALQTIPFLPFVRLILRYKGSFLVQY